MVTSNFIIFNKTSMSKNDSMKQIKSGL